MSDKPDILFLCIDCLRADKIFNSSLKIPNIRSLAKRGVSFTQAFSVTTTTTPSVTSILTGLYPVSHGLLSLTGYKLNDSVIPLPQTLKEMGYTTSAYLTGPLTTESGINRWFDNYFYRDRNVHYSLQWRKQLLDSFSETGKPSMKFIHFWEMHEPRFIPQELKGRVEGRSDYEKAFSVIDDHIGEILAKVDLDKTIVVLFGDHGESIAEDWLKKLLVRSYDFDPRLKRYMRFVGSAIDNIRRFIPIGPSDRYSSGFHGRFEGHGFHIYDFLTNVPLIISGPTLPHGIQIDKQVSQVDIAPTVIEMVTGIQQPGTSPQYGRSMLKILRQENWEQCAYMQASGVTLTDQSNWLIGLRTPKWKFARKFQGRRSGDEELYNHKKDRLEMKNLAAANPELVKQFNIKLDDFLAGMKTTQMDSDDQQQIQGKLEELGYL